MNLLNNAAKYTEPGGRIDVEGQRDGEQVVLRVRDTGLGIAPDILPRRFLRCSRRRITRWIERKAGGDRPDASAQSGEFTQRRNQRSQRRLGERQRV